MKMKVWLSHRENADRGGRKKRKKRTSFMDNPYLYLSISRELLCKNNLICIRPTVQQAHCTSSMHLLRSPWTNMQRKICCFVFFRCWPNIWIEECITFVVTLVTCVVHINESHYLWISRISFQLFANKNAEKSDHVVVWSFNNNKFSFPQSNILF